MLNVSFNLKKKHHLRGRSAGSYRETTQGVCVNGRAPTWKPLPLEQGASMLEYSLKYSHMRKNDWAYGRFAEGRKKRMKSAVRISLNLKLL